MKSQTHSASRREISTQRTPLSTYLAGAVGAAAVIAAPQAEAAVTAVTFGFGTEYTAADGSNNSWTVGPGLGTLRGYATAVALALGLNPSNGFGSVYQTASVNATIGLPTFFANGTVIGAGGNGALGTAYFQQNYSPARDFTTDQLNQNIAFKTKANNWGWANVSWTEATKTLAINSAYVESVANTNITVGDVGAIPEPSRALLALAGLGGVALRRRRKQAV